MAAACRTRAPPHDSKPTIRKEYRGGIELQHCWRYAFKAVANPYDRHVGICA